MDEGGGNAGAILVSMPSLVAAFVQKDEHADHKANADHMIGLLLCQDSECNSNPSIFPTMNVGLLKAKEAKGYD